MTKRDVALFTVWLRWNQFCWYVQGLFNPEHRGTSWYANTRPLFELVDFLHDFENGGSWQTQGRPDDWERRCREAFRRHTGREYHQTDSLKSDHFWTSVGYEGVTAESVADRPQWQDDGISRTCRGLCQIHKPVNDAHGATNRIVARLQADQRAYVQRFPGIPQLDLR